MTPTIDLAQALRRWDEAADEIESLRAMIGVRDKWLKQLRARVAELEQELAEGCIDVELVRLRAEVERLKELRRLHPNAPELNAPEVNELIKRLAACHEGFCSAELEIASLHARVAELEAALKKIVKADICCDAECHAEEIARAALEKKP